MHNYYNKTDPFPIIDITIYFIAIFLFHIVVMIFYFTNGIPLLSENVMYARVDAQNVQGANIYYRIFLYAIPIICMVFISYWYILRRRFLKYVAVYVFIFTCINLLLLGFKGYVLWFTLLTAMMMNIYMQNRNIILMGFVLLAIGIFSGVVVTAITYDLDYIDAGIKLLERATTGSSYGYAVAIYELYPYLQSGQLSIPDNLNIFLAEWKFGSGSAMALHSLALTVTIVGTLIIYVGTAGMIGFSFMMGLVFQHFYGLIFKYKKSPLVVSLVLYITYMIVGVINRGSIKNLFLQPLASIVFLGLSFIFFLAIFKLKGRLKFTKIIIK